MPPWVRNSSCMHVETIRLSFMATHFDCLLRVDTRRSTLRSESGYRLLTWFQTCVVLWSRSLRFVRTPVVIRSYPFVGHVRWNALEAGFRLCFSCPRCHKCPYTFHSHVRAIQSDRCDMNCSNLYYFDQLILIKKTQNQYRSKAWNSDLGQCRRTQLLIQNYSISIHVLKTIHLYLKTSMQPISDLGWLIAFIFKCSRPLIQQPIIIRHFSDILQTKQKWVCTNRPDYHAKHQIRN